MHPIIKNLALAINIPAPINHLLQVVQRIAPRGSGNGDGSDFNLAQQTVLDIGFGRGDHWQYWKGPSLSVTPLDIQKSSEINATSASVVDIKNPILGRAPQDLAKIPDGSFDFVIAFDLIEHLSKENGFLLLYEMERISKVASMVFTPNGHVYQPPTQDNYFQAHVSGWKPNELRRFGWSYIKGCTGLKFFFGAYAKPKFFANSLFMNTIRAVTSRVALCLASVAFSFVALKLRSEIGQPIEPIRGK
jgi:hypothetical protein